VVGGLTIDEPGSDLPVALALVSSLHDRPLDAGLIAFGELGLTGEVRPVAYGEERLREAAKQGFTSALVPKDNLPRAAPEGLRLIPVSRIEQALNAVLKGS
jgi:DNA repair protein RadA/Sms